MSYEKSINLLKAKGVEFEAGLTDVEMGKIESTYKIEFPKSLKIFLMTVLPVSRGFYNWRNFEEDNIRFIKMVMNRPIEDVCDLEDYFEVEFGAKEQEAICFENIQPISFWTDII